MRTRRLRPAPAPRSAGAGCRSRPRPSRWRSAGTCMSAWPPATSRSRSPSATSRSRTAPAPGGAAGGAAAGRGCPPRHGDRWPLDEPDVKVAGRWRQVTERSTRSGRASTWWSLGSETPTPARRLVQHHQGHTQPGHAQPRSPPTRRRSTPPCWRRCCQRRGSAATAPPAPRRGRPRQGAGAAAPDARAQPGPQRPGRHRRAGVRPNLRRRHSDEPALAL